MKKFILSLLSIFLIAFGGIFVYNSFQIIHKDNEILNSLNSENTPVKPFSFSNSNNQNTTPSKNENNTINANNSNGSVSSLISSLFKDISNGNASSTVPNININKGDSPNTSSQNTSPNDSSNPNGKLYFPQGNADVNGISLSKTLQGNEEINNAAHKITASYSSPIDKAKALYVWIAANITYNNTYAKDLTQGIYPANMGTAIDTFNSRQGVCSGFAALYFVMARDVGLNVKLIAGQGLGDPTTNDWGSHMWNEVYINNQWIPVDTTFANSYTVAMKKLNATPELKGYLSNENTTINKVNGFNMETYTVPSADFFNPPNFYSTHKNSETLATWIN